MKSWGWGLGLLVAGGALTAYIVSRTFGLPGLEAEPDAWLEPLGVVSLASEGLFSLIALYVLTRQPALEKVQQSTGQPARQR